MCYKQKQQRATKKTLHISNVLIHTTAQLSSDRQLTYSTA
jgi:hypothetical protein